MTYGKSSTNTTPFKNDAVNSKGHDTNQRVASSPTKGTGLKLSLEGDG